MHKDLKRILRSGVLLLALVGLLSIAPLTGAAPLAPTERAIAAATPMAATMPAQANCTLSGTTRSCDLYATTGTISLPGLATPLTIWGYAASAGVSATIPGPTLIAYQGETVKVTLHNALPQPSSLAFPAMAIAPDMVGLAASTSLTKTYTFAAARPGSSLYEAGMTPNGNRQVALGMFGALIVRPGTAVAPLDNQAYDANSTFQDEGVLIFSELDPALNNSTNPLTFDLHTYAPKYWLINGKAYPQTANITSAAGNKVLLRYLNAGLMNHSVGTLGLHSWVYGTDGKAMAKPYQMMAETIAAGQTLDVITTLPSTAPVGTKYTVYNAANHLDNSGARTTTVATSPIKYGGMLTFITTGASTGGSSGPTISAVTATPNSITTTGVSVALSATMVLPAGSTFSAAEYFIDTNSGATGTGTAMTRVGTTNTLTATIPAATINALANGNHTIYVRAASTASAVTTWGSFNSTFVTVNRAAAVGPVVTLNSISPNPANGSADMTVDVTASTTTTNNQNVASAEYFLDPTTSPPTTTRGQTMTVGPAGLASTTTFSATIPAATISGKADGTHHVFVRAKDALGNWGALADLTFTVDKTGPLTSSIANAYQLDKSLKITATVTDALSNIAAAEAFIDSVPANSNGTGIVLQPTSGTFNNTNATVYFIISPADLATLSQGTHKVYIHGQDAAGNWGSTTIAAATANFVVDRTAPTFNSLSATRTGSNGGIRFTIRATDPAVSSTITAVEYFEGTDPGAGSGKAMALPGSYTPAATLNNVVITVNGFSSGTHNVSVRVRDAAGNWSAVRTIRVTNVV